MKPEETIRLLKALADRSRLRIINALIERPQYVEELSERLELAASTVSFHLKKMEEAGLVYSVKEQYYMTYHLQTKLLDIPVIELVKFETENKHEEVERMKQYRNKVMKAFFRYGKLTKIPVQRKKRRIILEEIAKKFKFGRQYAEKEVNLLIAEFHDDFCTLRREMICERIMDRAKGYYWLLK